ncbi:MAG: hypothetical protein OXH28_02215 [bacterium]|nr:hypothetical protein [bacterium]
MLIDLARSMIQNQDPELVGIWPRAAAILARQAFEISLDRFWLAVAPGVENASAHAQLTCLADYIDSELASRVRYIWHGLSIACHHQAYELPPNAQELEGWLTDIDALVEEAERQSRDGRCAASPKHELQSEILESC